MTTKSKTLQPDARANCYRGLEGLWACDPRALNSLIADIRSGGVSIRPRAEVEAAGARDRRDQLGLSVIEGVAVIPIHGYMLKGFSWLGTDTRRVRAQLRAATELSDVKAVLLHVDSPGGYVDGTTDLVDEIRRTDKSKPVLAFIEDTGASAAVWVASQARGIMANRTAKVGSIGTFATVYDFSKAFEKEGVKVHVISTGKFKGAGVPGSAVTDPQIEEVRNHVEALQRHFQADLSLGRSHNARFKYAAVNDGRVWLASEAKTLGLIDGIGTIDAAVGLARGEAVAFHRGRAEKALAHAQSVAALSDADAALDEARRHEREIETRRIGRLRK